jgi:hypothetical protein
MQDVEIVRGYVPGSIGRVAELHGTYYHQHWSFSLFFEARVATGLAEFLGRYNQQRDGFWIAVAGTLKAPLRSMDSMPKTRARICAGSSCLMRYGERALVNNSSILPSDTVTAQATSGSTCIHLKVSTLRDTSTKRRDLGL